VLTAALRIFPSGRRAVETSLVSPASVRGPRSAAILASPRRAGRQRMLFSAMGNRQFASHMTPPCRGSALANSIGMICRCKDEQGNRKCLELNSPNRDRCWCRIILQRREGSEATFLHNESRHFLMVSQHRLRLSAAGQARDERSRDEDAWNDAAGLCRNNVLHLGAFGAVTDNAG
jgi:hypothetical protein